MSAQAKESGTILGANVGAEGLAFPKVQVEGGQADQRIEGDISKCKYLLVLLGEGKGDLCVEGGQPGVEVEEGPGLVQRSDVFEGAGREGRVLARGALELLCKGFHKQHQHEGGCEP